MSWLMTSDANSSSGTELKAKCGKEGSRRRYGRMAVIVRNPTIEELPTVWEVLCGGIWGKEETLKICSGGVSHGLAS